MKLNTQQHHYRSIRLLEYDYSHPGAYFITAVAWQRESLYGEIWNGEMHLNVFGKIFEHAWLDLPQRYKNVELGAFCVMPDHVHGIIVLNDGNDAGAGSDVGAGLRPAPTMTTGSDYNRVESFS